MTLGLDGGENGRINVNEQQAFRSEELRNGLACVRA